MALYECIDMGIAMDIHVKFVDMDMDVKFHIHGNQSDVL